MPDRVALTPGLRLSERFYTQVIAPQLAGVPHSAALLGWGSDVLGYDTERSTDHGWGPRVLIFTDAQVAEPDLPASFDGVPVRFGWAGVPPRSWVTVTRLDQWLRGQLGTDATGGLDVLDWLLVPQQRLLGVTAGAVFADQTGALAAVRSRLEWYPDEVWRWMLACQWHRIAQEEAFVARTAEVGDTTGSTVVAARQVRELMRLALLLARRYAPYQKWLGTAFARIAHDDGLPDALACAVTGDQHALGAAYLAVAGRQDSPGSPSLDYAACSSRSCQVHTQISLPSASARIQKARASSSDTSFPPAASAAAMRESASSCGPVMSKWMRVRCGRGSSICWNHTAGPLRCGSTRASCGPSLPGSSM